MTDISIGVVGCAGRMGVTLLREIAATEGCRVAGGTELAGHAAIGADIGELAGLGAVGVAVGDDPAALFAGVDAVLDFTTPAASVDNAALAAKTATIHVVGTTGLDADQAAALEAAAAETAVVWAPNMSIGVNILFALTKQVAAVLGEDYDIEIVEMHHRHKVDAPSGTALELGHRAAAGRGVALDSVARRGRDGHTGARRAGEIGFAVLRGGDVVGDHSVVFAADGERIELGHRASGRQVFAKGAVRAALWARGKPAGLYGMKDVLGLPG